MIGKGQQIAELTEQVQDLCQRLHALRDENGTLREALRVSEENVRVLKKKTPESLQSALSEKSLQKARDLLTGANQRAKQLVTDAEQQAGDILSNAKAEAEELLCAARTESESIRQQAKEESESSARMQLSRISEALALLAQENNALTNDIRRQSIALSSALCEATDRVLRFNADPAECKRVFADSLAGALKTSVEVGEIVSAVTLHSRAEFDAIGSYGFRNNAMLTRIILPADSVVELPESFFFGCSSLREVTLPVSLETIGNYAFFACTKLEGLLLPRELEHIGAYAFADCSSLKALHIPGGVKGIGAAAFRNCESLTSVEIDPNGCLREIGNHAFQNCRALTGCVLPTGLTVLPTSLFYGCERLTSIDIPATIETMEADVFQGCVSLQSASFHNGEMVLMPNSTAGLKNAHLTLSGKAFAWAEVTEPIKLCDFIGRASTDAAWPQSGAQEETADAGEAPQEQDMSGQTTEQPAADGTSIGE